MTNRALSSPLMVLLTACAAAPASTPLPEGPSPGTPSSPVERLLELSKIEGIVDGRAPEMTRRIALLAGDLTDAELERLVPAVRESFDPTLLREDVARFIEAEATEGRVERVLSVLQGGANAELTRVTDGYEPPLTLEEYATGLADSPPSESRVRLMIGWTRVQGAGDFYILLDQALAEAAHMVVRTFRPGTAQFEPISGEPLFDQLEASFNAALVTFLYRLEPAPDSLLAAATEEYAGPDGQWYVEAYSLAVAQAMRTAAGRAVDALTRARGQRAPDSARASERWSSPTSGYAVSSSTPPF